MRFSVITPSFRNSNWLKLCLASVADQQVDVEHIVQDAGSDDGTLDWLPHDQRVKAFVERDQGMYDAVNRGLRRSNGDILSYLNCDEQYLPGALAAVGEYFTDHPQVDIIFANIVVVDAAGNYLFHRKVQPPRLHHTWVCHLATMTCATFFRRSLLTDHDLFFNAGLRDVGDAEWMLRVLRQRIPMGVLRQFTSAFTFTGENMSAKPNAKRESLELLNSAPPWARTLKWQIVLLHRLRRLIGGIYFQRPFAYEIFTTTSPNKRIRHAVEKPGGRWKPA